MDDAQLLAALEAGTLPPEQFDHRAHLRAGYLYLRSAAFPQATARMCAALRAYTAALGKPERYHETVTVAFMALIAARLRHDPTGGADGWERFSSRHPQLFERGLLLDYYPQAVLETSEARAGFVLPPPSGTIAAPMTTGG